MKKDFVTRVVWASACAWAIAGSGGVARGQGGPGSEDLSVYLPAGQARALVAKECSACHDLRGVIELRKSAKDWEATVLELSSHDEVRTALGLDAQTFEMIQPYLYLRPRGK